MPDVKKLIQILKFVGIIVASPVFVSTALPFDGRCEAIFITYNNRQKHMQSVANAVIAYVRETGEKPKVPKATVLYKQHYHLKDNSEYVALFKDARDVAKILFADRFDLLAKQVIKFVHKYGTTPKVAIDSVLFSRYNMVRWNPQFISLLKKDRQTARLIEETEKPFSDLSFHRILWHIKSFKDVPIATARTDLRLSYQQIKDLPEFQRRLKKDPEAWEIFQRSQEELRLEDAISIRHLFLKTGGAPSAKRDRHLYTIFYVHKNNPMLHNVIAQDPVAWQLLRLVPPYLAEITASTFVDHVNRTGQMPTEAIAPELASRLNRFRRDPLFVSTVAKNPFAYELLKNSSASPVQRLIDDTVEYLILHKSLPNQNVDRALYDRFLRYKEDPTYRDALAGHEIVGPLYLALTLKRK